MVNDLTLILLTWRKWLAPNNASRQQTGFNSGFKGLKRSPLIESTHIIVECTLIICIIRCVFFYRGTTRHRADDIVFA